MVTAQRWVLGAAESGAAADRAEESARCLSADDCFDYLEGRADGAEIEKWRNHLDVCDGCRILIAEAARSALISAPSGSEKTPRTLADDEVVANRYRILRFVARGGMGEVYEAFDSVLQERLALKTLVLTAIDQEEAVVRLLDEVRIARRVAHPNVCRIWEVGIHRFSAPREGAVPFLTMDYLTGETLAQRLTRGGRLAPTVAVSIFQDLCEGLAAVHDAGIVHRDLKSDNVFLTADGAGRERVVVMDFGLARALEQPRSRFASSGRRLLGTPAYMAPEQVAGGKVTSAADIYALGVVMFEVLTGQVPFSGETAASIALSRLQKEAPKPSAIVPEVGPAWDALVARCLARDPRARPVDANAVRAALDGLAATPLRKRTETSWGSIAIASTLMAGLAALFSAVWDPSPSKLPLAPLASPPPMASLAPPSSATVTVPIPPVATLASTPVAPQQALPTNAERTTVEKSSRARSRVPTTNRPKRAPAPAMTDAAALVDSAEELLAQGKIAEACEAGERAAGQSDSAGAQAFLGRCYMRLGSPERARKSYAKYLELAPNAANAEFVRAMIRDDQP